MSKRTTTFLFIGLIALLAAFPMFFNLGSEDIEEPFAGTDATAETLIAEENPDYEPWFEPLIGELPGEIESGLFALQAALGAGFLGYALGVFRGRKNAEDSAVEAIISTSEN
ncbi:Energy-coupling factor transporter probable substrate-capture protein CbiN [Corynebacterium kutscheri]|uniref:Cobalt transport protein CbiN n=1 Tax=Corynebacterium kutscheri TaxID=35755 RepID=A0AB38VW68_9CORY|nr:energy-coupling factor ABC transporter substrate-binding protein [Corynebacterium kutscheri]VEH07054.1 Energy-coupling factor transporter probable substrate-capture protein CbiN [Corynebacterium kutscheri]VEH79550.1 Energy-coupling factor transporter probable substrate-capture protein CbiN [Corynebacterium kutscheri]